MKFINMFRVGIPHPQPLFQKDIIIIINMKKLKLKFKGTGFVGEILILNTFMIFMNRKI